MKTLIIGNFRTGSWYLHKSYEAKGFMGLGELLSNLDNDAENKINKFKQRSNVVAKLHPSQLITDSENTYYRLCELADEIIYIQRQDTRQQVISFAVAKEQFDKLDKRPWLRNRKVFNNNLTDEILDDVFERLDKNNRLIQKIFKKFPSKVITLEKDLPYDPYPHKYNYTGNWQPPYNFKMLGE